MVSKMDYFGYSKVVTYNLGTVRRSIYTESLDVNLLLSSYNKPNIK